MCAGTGLASLPHFRSCAYLVSRGLRPTLIPWQTALAADPAKPRLVLGLDYRGHGQSEYDRNPDNYALPVALADLSAVLIALEIAPAIFVGTSYGGLLAMMLAVAAADRHRRCHPQRYRSRCRTARFGAAQGLHRKAPRPAQLRGGWRDFALALRGAVPEARTAGMDRVCPAHLARTRRPTAARPRSESWRKHCKEPICSIRRRCGLTLMRWRGYH